MEKVSVDAPNKDLKDLFNASFEKIEVECFKLSNFNCL